MHILYNQPTLLLPHPQPAQLLQLPELIGGTTFGMGGKRAIDLQQRQLIIRQARRMLLVRQTEQIIGRSVQTPADLADEVQTQPSSAGEIIVQRGTRDLQILCKPFLRDVLFLHEFADALYSCFHRDKPFRSGLKPRKSKTQNHCVLSFFKGA